MWIFKKQDIFVKKMKKGEDNVQSKSKILKWKVELKYREWKPIEKWGKEFALRYSLILLQWGENGFKIQNSSQIKS